MNEFRLYNRRHYSFYYYYFHETLFFFSDDLRMLHRFNIFLPQSNGCWHNITLHDVVSIREDDSFINPRFHHSGCVPGESYRPYTTIWSGITKEQIVNVNIRRIFSVKLNFNRLTKRIIHLRIIYIASYYHTCDATVTKYIQKIVCAFFVYANI